MLQINKKETDLQKLLSVCKKRREYGCFKYFTEISLTYSELEIYKKLFELYERIGLDFCFTLLEPGEYNPLLYGYSNFQIMKIRGAELFEYLEDKQDDEIDEIFAAVVDAGSCLLISERINKQITAT